MNSETVTVDRRDIRKAMNRTRKVWGIDPTERVHSSPKGLKGYDRSQTRRIERNWGSSDDE